LVSENYPALAYQAHLFLKQRKHKVIRPAYVMDVFFLDVLCELLDTPLHFFNFIHKRLDLFERIQSQNEMAVLSYHLVYNLWFEDKYDLVDLGDDFSTHIDAAMLVRREGLPGKKTPEGILTKLRGTFFDRIVTEIGNYEADNALEMGYYLLAMSEDAAKQFSEACEFILKGTASDGKMHDFTLGTSSEGITVHSSLESDAKAYERLRTHCEMKKYQQKAAKWYGLLLWPNRSTVTRMALGLTHAWEQLDEMDRFLETFPTQEANKTVKKAIRSHSIESRRKVGRNDPCPCGSGLKFKKCSWCNS
jgi:SEC-C motif-containing protein